MKKFLSIFMAMTIIVCSALFTACGGISSDWEKVEANLIAEDYDIEVSSDSSWEINEHLDALDVNSYTYKDRVNYVICAEDFLELIFIFFCEDSATAEEIKGDIKSWAVKGFAETARSSEDDVVYGCNGSVFYIGTKDAVKAAK